MKKKESKEPVGQPAHPSLQNWGSVDGDDEVVAVVGVVMVDAVCVSS